jgi:hypothetical protein
VGSLKNRRKEIIEIVESAGLELIGPVETQRRSSHTKVPLRYHGQDFFLVTSLVERGGIETWYDVFRADVRRAKRAIDSQDPTLLSWLGIRAP